MDGSAGGGGWLKVVIMDLCARDCPNFANWRYHTAFAFKVHLIANDYSNCGHPLPASIYPPARPLDERTTTTTQLNANADPAAAAADERVGTTSVVLSPPAPSSTYVCATKSFCFH